MSLSLLRLIIMFLSPFDMIDFYDQIKKCYVFSSSFVVVVVVAYFQCVWCDVDLFQLLNFVFVVVVVVNYAARSALLFALFVEQLVVSCDFVCVCVCVYYM